MAKKNKITPDQYYQDITKTGLQTFRQLQAQNKLTEQDLQDFKEIEDFSNSITKLSDYQANPELDRPGKVESNLARTKTAFGESSFDKDVVNEYEFEHLGDLRAEKQEPLMQLTSGIGIGPAILILIFAALIYFIFKLFTNNSNGNKQ